MPVYKDGNNGTFYVQCYYRDARGSKRHKTKRGFSSEVEAAVWESQFKSLNGGAMTLDFPCIGFSYLAVSAQLKLPMPLAMRHTSPVRGSCMYLSSPM